MKMRYVEKGELTVFPIGNGWIYKEAEESGIIVGSSFKGVFIPLDKVQEFLENNGGKHGSEGNDEEAEKTEDS
jgi:hypothetical protein